MQIVPLTGIDIRVVPGSWPLPSELRAAVADYWAVATTDNPHLWNGRVLGLLAAASVPMVDDDGVLRAEAREDAYSAMMLWRSLEFPEIGIRHAFGWALIVSQDGALIYGVMGSDAANAGRVYPPDGELESRDVLPDGQVDFLGSIALELAEETGLSIADARVGMTVAVLDGLICWSAGFSILPNQQMIWLPAFAPIWPCRNIANWPMSW
ncbi:MAG: hypothetical protein MO852_16350 [Candidatus Devosia euplotis]|nr:hypothetical protein [Candidatus Devosia euplotis]